MNDDATPDAGTAHSVPAAGRLGHGHLRVTVVAGGRPTDEETAALIVALSALQADGSPAVSGPSGWQRAVLLEGVGARRLSQRTDLDAPVGTR